MEKKAAKGCIVLGALLLLAAGGILAWYFTSGNNNDENKSENGGGFLGTGLFAKKNETETTPTTTSSTVAPSLFPSVAPSLAPTETPYPFNQCAPTAAACCNGLENLCDWPVNDILFGMVHNAMATTDKFVVANNDKPLDQALKRGYRGISLDVCSCAGKFQLCHGVCGLGEMDPTEAFSMLVTFLRENPNEVLLLTIELNNDAGQTVNLNNFYNTILREIDGFEDYLYVHPNRDASWPTLGELIETDNVSLCAVALYVMPCLFLFTDTGNNCWLFTSLQRLIAFHLNGPDCETEGTCPDGLHYYFDYAQETDFEFESIEEILNVQTSCVITRGATTTTGAFYGVNNFVAAEAFEIENQRAAAVIANSLDFAKDRLQACSELVQAGTYLGDGDVNMLSVDFWSIGDIVQVVQEYNRDLGIREELY